MNNDELTIVLGKPVTAHGEEIDHITLRAPTTADLIELGQDGFVAGGRAVGGAEPVPRAAREDGPRQRERQQAQGPKARRCPGNRGRRAIGRPVACVF